MERQVSPNMFGPHDRQADLSSLRLWGNEPPHGAEPQILAQARTHCRVASGQQPVRKKGVVVGEVVIDGTPARAVTGTVRLPRQADRAGMTFNSLRTLSWPNVGNSLEAPLRISGLRDAVRRIRRSRDGFGTAGPTLRHSADRSCMSSGRTSGDGSVCQLLRRCSILAGSRSGL
jgi:hypothetical protein